VLLLLTLCAFAANSVLCRVALATDAADPYSFSAIRIVSGALVLGLILASRNGLRAPRLDPVAVLALYLYALCFSVAYVGLDAGTGALLLFSAVQVTLLGVALWRGERPPWGAWAGFALAALGLGWLLAPGVSAPPPLAAASMLAAGVAWGVYTLRGARAASPLVATAWNFIAAVPLALLAVAVQAATAHVDARGALAAIASGALASGLGYALWYRILPGLPAMVAASSQLAVPLLAAVAGVLFLGEAFTSRLAVGGALILGGLALVFGLRTRRV